jgi:hypothetical protein
VTDNRLSRFGPLSGVAFVVLQLAGVAIGAADGRAMVALGDPRSKILDAFSKHVGTGVWIGAYLEALSIAAFVVFAVWLFRSVRGAHATAGLIAAGAYAGVGIVALIAGDALEYGLAHGMGDQTALALFYVQSGLFFATWGIAAALLALAPVDGWLRRSALAIAALLLVATAFPTAGPSQLPNMLFLIWAAVTGVVAARRREIAPARVAAVTS